MWPFPRVDAKRLTISLHTDYVTFALFSRADDKNIPYRLHAYQSVPFCCHEYEQAKLFNPTSLSRLTNDFIGAKQLHNRSTIIGVSGNLIQEKIVSVDAGSTVNDFGEESLDQLLWESIFLYTQDYSHNVYYVCGMPRELIFQLQLFALTNTYDLVMVATPMIGYLRAYVAKEGNNFSVQRFGDQMMTQKNQIQKLITIDDLAKILYIEKNISFNGAADIGLITELFGLFLAGADDESN